MTVFYVGIDIYMTNIPSIIYLLHFPLYSFMYVYAL